MEHCNTARTLSKAISWDPFVDPVKILDAKERGERGAEGAWGARLKEEGHPRPGWTRRGQASPCKDSSPANPVTRSSVC